ncbi:MAG: hypothetical protein DCC49_12755 [Acidobacteria bacterium]|nr:MAG: hypothetical protein DCC49_12755 [Acidobacteriota bacterium]
MFVPATKRLSEARRVTLHRTTARVIRFLIVVSLFLALGLGTVSAVESSPSPEPTETSTLYGIPCVPNIPIPGCP